MPKHFGETSLITLIGLIEDKFNYLKKLTSSKADLVDGKIPASQIPDFGSFDEIWRLEGNTDFTDTINQMIDDKIVNVEVEPFKPSVKNYGAKGDGTTDDTSAFQDALSKERVVFVHGGTYILNGTLVIRENCCLELSQDTILKFANTSGNCIEMRGSAVLRGNHGNIDVSNNFTGNVISVDTGLDGVVHGNIPPYASGTPLWKRQRFIYDVNITRTHKGHQGSYDGSHSGTALYISANFETKESYNGSTTAPISCIWAMTVSGLRIGGAFDYGINIQNRDRTESGYGNEGDPAWNHDMRIEAVIVGCETGVRVFNCNTAHLAVTIEPGLSIVDVDGAKVKYAKNGIVLEHSHNIDLSQSLVWDWDTNATLVNKDEKNKHIALIGDCRGTILSDHYYHESSEDIRSLIYTDTPSNFNNLIILQEPITRWFKPIDGKPYFFDGSSHKELTTQEEFKSLFDTTMKATFINQLPIATDEDGTRYNGTGYKVGVSMAGYLPPTISNDGYGLLTGFIPVSKGAIIRFSDLWWNVENQAQRYYERIFFFKEDKTAIPNGSNYALCLHSGDIDSTKNNNLISNYQESENGTSFTLGSNTQLDDVAYIRVNFYRGNIGAKPIITVNEEIEYEQVGVLSDGIKIKSENVIGDVGSGGDMVKSVYDTNNNGKVDNADNSDKLGGQLPEYYAKAEDVLTEEDMVSVSRFMSLEESNFFPSGICDPEGLITPVQYCAEYDSETGEIVKSGLLGYDYTMMVEFVGQGYMMNFPFTVQEDMKIGNGGKDTLFIGVKYTINGVEKLTEISVSITDETILRTGRGYILSATNKNGICYGVIIGAEPPTDEAPTKDSDKFLTSGATYNAIKNFASKTDIPTIPTNVSAFENDKGYLTEHQSLAEYAKKAEIPTVPTNVSAFTNDVGYLKEETDPTVPSWAKEPNRPTYTADDVGAETKGTASNLVSAHNTGTEVHSDIRLLIKNLTDRLDAVANSSDEDLDQLSEIVAYIKSNKSLIDSVTTSKVNVADIVNNLTTNVLDKPLSAAQGVVLKALIDAITVPTKVSQLENDKGYLTQHQDLSAYAKTSEVNSKLNGYATTTTVSALEVRVKALETALNGFSFQDAESAPTSAGEKVITFVDAG